MNWGIEKKERLADIENIINKYLPKEEGYQKIVLEAMNYSVASGGKRLRPMLMQETYRMFGGQDQVIEPFMAAMEMIHTYSLVHDDLPAMDNDMYRRGRETTHIKYNEGIAILAGDGLLNYAFETACQAFDNVPFNPLAVKAVRLLAQKSGIYGMIGGQTADIQAEDMKKEDITEELLLFIHKNKTAALIEASMMVGAVLAGASDEEVEAVEQIANNVGIAFQIQDDILDITSTLEVLGKMTGSDEKNHKVTYVTLRGMEQAKKDVEELSRQALSLMASLKYENKFLVRLIEELITREK